MIRGDFEAGWNAALDLPNTEALGHNDTAAEYSKVNGRRGFAWVEGFTAAIHVCRGDTETKPAIKAADYGLHRPG
tara:strand:+ start:66 stop:290 length:225 start_codon:yes stop_codon:yes gene_type:complete